MATKRRRGASWEYTVRRKGLLPKPLYLTFADEAEGDRYCVQLEALLDRGIVPPEVLDATDTLATLADAIRAYRDAVALKGSETALLAVLAGRIGATRLDAVDYPWAERWVERMKRVQGLSPSTIRHQVGALARLFDWLVRRHACKLPVNPLRLLPRGYSTYNARDAHAVLAVRATVPTDESRDRRFQDGEEARIRAILAGAKPDGRQRALTLRHRDALVLLFDLALETAMRLSELYTLEWGQVDLAGRTIYLDRTKNGSRRQVPMSSVALAALTQARPDDAQPADRLFPWWDGEQSEHSRRRTTALLSRQFARIFAAAGCRDLGFHSLRHEAISRLYERTTLDTTVIRKIVGHFSPAAHDRYVNIRASTVSTQLW